MLTDINSSGINLEHKHLNALAVISTAFGAELKKISAALGTYAEDPLISRLSEPFGMLQRAASFCGYWSIGAYVGAMRELALLIEREPMETIGRVEYTERVKTLGAGVQALADYLKDISKGLNASNAPLNDKFKYIVRKCRPSLLALELQEAKEIFFMPVPLSLEIEAGWKPAPSASREAFIAAARHSSENGLAKLDDLVVANPYAGLAGMLEGFASQGGCIQKFEVSKAVREELERLVDFLSDREPVVAPSPDAFLFSRLLYAAAHNLGEDHRNQAFRKRYSLLNPAVMKNHEGVINMHGLAKEYSAGIQKVLNAFQQANLMRSHGRAALAVDILKTESAKLGFDSFTELTLVLEREVQKLVEVALQDDEREAQEREAAPKSPPGEQVAFRPSNETTEAWLRCAQVLFLIKEAVETWSTASSQEELLNIAARVKADGVIDVCSSVQSRNRDLAIYKIAAWLSNDLDSLKSAIDVAFRQAADKTLKQEGAVIYADMVCKKARPIFTQIRGTMEILGLSQAALFAGLVQDAICDGENWTTPELRAAMFDQITRYSVFIQRLRPSTLIDVQPEESGIPALAAEGSPGDDTPVIFHVEPGGIPLDAEVLVATQAVEEPAAAAAPHESDNAPMVAEAQDGSVVAQADQATVSLSPDSVPALETPPNPPAAAIYPVAEARFAPSNDAVELGSAIAEQLPMRALTEIQESTSEPVSNGGALPPAAAPPDIKIVTSEDPPRTSVALDSSLAPISATMTNALTVDAVMTEDGSEVGSPAASATGLTTAEINPASVEFKTDGADSVVAAGPTEQQPAPSIVVSVAEAEGPDMAAASQGADVDPAPDGNDFDFFGAMEMAPARSVEELTQVFLLVGPEIEDSVADIDEELAKVLMEESERCMSAIFQGLDDIQGAQEEDQIEILASIKREIHTLKGACRTCGLLRAGTIFHAMEDEMDMAAGSLPRFLETIQAFAAGIEGARELLESFRSDFGARGAGQAPGAAPQASEAPLQAALDAPANAAEVPPADPTPTSQLDNTAPPANSSVSNDLVEQPPAPGAVVVQFPKAPIQAPAPAPAPAAGAVGEDSMSEIRSVPKSRKPIEESVRLPISLVAHVGQGSSHVLMSSRKIQESIERFRKVAVSLESNVNRMTSALRALEITASAKISATSASGSSAAGFDPLELDRYTSLQETIRSLTETHQDVLTDIAALKSELNDVRRDEADLTEVGDALQRDSSGMMLMPLATQAARLASVVERANADTGKKVELDIDGDCRVPAAAMDKLIPVFEHILRNSVAHGIEADRAAVGKSPVGRILISHPDTAVESGGVINISVRDDGAGINHDLVHKIALARGVAKPGKDYSRQEIREFIFANGFSTSEKVSQLSGRGVGLDVVRDTVSKLGGVITLGTEEGAGTEFTITIPTDAATMVTLPVSAGGFSVMLPISIIKEILPLGVGSSERVEIGEFGVKVDGRVIDIVSLRSKVPSTARQQAQDLSAPGNPFSSGQLILMREGGGTRGVLVDFVRMQSRVVVTTLGPFVKGIPGFIAGTVLDDGRVGLIVNPIRMADVVGDASDQNAVGSKKTAKKVMIVDDSPSMRLVTGRVVKRMGFEIETCADGFEALERLKTGVNISAFLVDLEMPGMDGFELMTQLRGRIDHRDTPIVVISSRTADKHKLRAASLGASEYLAKPYEESALERVLDTFVAR